MLCPRALSAAPRPCLVRQFYAAKCRPPADYSGWWPPAAYLQTAPIQQQSRGFKKRAFKPRVQGVVITTETGDAERAGARVYGPKGGARGRDQDKRTKGETALRDKQLLEYPLIHLKNRDSSTLSEPLATHDVLADVDLETDTLLCVYLPSPKAEASADAAAEAENEMDDEEAAASREAASKRPQIPICVVMNRAKYEEHLENERREQRIRELGTKEMEINWTIDQHDLGHKLRRLREFLGKGYTVQVTFLKRRHKKRSANNDDDNIAAAETVRLVKEAAAEVPGAKECKRPEGNMGRTLTLTFDAPGVKNWKLAAAAEAAANQDSPADSDSSAAEASSSSA